MKRKIVEKNLEFTRLGEEEALFADEMKSVLTYFQFRGDFLKQKRACLMRKLENSDFSVSGNSHYIISLYNLIYVLFFKIFNVMSNLGIYMYENFFFLRV